MTIVLCKCGRCRQIPPYRCNKTISGPCFEPSCTNNKNQQVQDKINLKNSRVVLPAVTKLQSLDDILTSRTPSVLRKAG